MLLFYIIFATTFAVGISGNLFVIGIITFCLGFKNVANVFVFNLAIADALYLAWIPLVIVRAVIKEWPWGETVCKLYNFFTGIPRWGSAIFLTMLCVDRYLAICHPITTRPYRTPKVALFSALGCWVLVISLMSPLLIHASLQSHDVPIVASTQNVSNLTGLISQTGANKQYETKYQCVISLQKEAIDPVTNETMLVADVQSRKAFTLYTVLSSVFFLILTWTLYRNIISALKQQSSLIRNRDSPSCRQRRTKRKVTLMVLAVLVCYTLCWLPVLFITIAIEFFTPILAQLPQFVFYGIVYFSYSINYINSAVNPLLYTFMSDTYRKIIREQLCKAKPRSLENSEEAGGQKSNLLRNRTQSLKPGNNDKSFNEPTNSATSSLTPIRKRFSVQFRRRPSNKTDITLNGPSLKLAANGAKYDSVSPAAYVRGNSVCQTYYEDDLKSSRKSRKHRLLRLFNGRSGSITGTLSRFTNIPQPELHHCRVDISPSLNQNSPSSILIHTSSEVEISPHLLHPNGRSSNNFGLNNRLDDFSSYDNDSRCQQRTFILEETPPECLHKARDISNCDEKSSPPGNRAILAQQDSCLSPVDETIVVVTEPLCRVHLAKQNEQTNVDVNSMSQERHLDSNLDSQYWTSPIESHLNAGTVCVAKANAKEETGLICATDSIIQSQPLYDSKQSDSFL